MTTGADILKLIEEKGIKYVDLRFTDTKGKEQHVTVPTRVVDDAFFEDGKGFDGSSIAGWTSPSPRCTRAAIRTK